MRDLLAILASPREIVRNRVLIEIPGQIAVRFVLWNTRAELRALTVDLKLRDTWPAITWYDGHATEPVLSICPTLCAS